MASNFFPIPLPAVAGLAPSTGSGQEGG